jgi:hypothetical protein
MEMPLAAGVKQTVFDSVIEIWKRNWQNSIRNDVWTLKLTIGFLLQNARHQKNVPPPNTTTMCAPSASLARLRSNGKAKEDCVEEC